MDGFVKFVRGKLHGIRVTDANLNYMGSITLDPLHCKKVGIYPMEFVDIWNKNSGYRISTYVIYGEENSGCCILNGSAARTCQVGDELIIAASLYANPKFLINIKPKTLIFDLNNKPSRMLSYTVKENEDEHYDFYIQDLMN